MKAYRVKGMTCEGYVRAVTRAIERRVRGAAVSIALAKGLVTVPDALAATEIRAAVEDAGFTYEGVA